MIRAIGNDIVDLYDADCQNTLSNKKFINRVFSSTEKEMIDKSLDANTLIWKLWAAKEAAFKTLRRLEPATSFSHARFIVNKNLNSVQHESTKIMVEVTHNAQYVFAVACISEQESNLSLIKNYINDAEKSVRNHAQLAEESVNLINLSTAVRKQAISAISVHCHCELSLISIVRKENGNKLLPPQIYISGKFYSDFISLTHHGRFFATSLFFDA